MTEEETIKINTGEIKGNIKKVINNQYVFLFSVLFLAVLLLLVSKIYGFGSGISVIASLSSAFTTNLLIYLLLALAISAVLAHYRKFKWMFLPVVIWLLVTTAILRTQNIDQLKDGKTGNYTLGPDLDPFLYLRHATEIDQGNLGPIDYFRKAPLGVKSYAYSNIMPWVIFYMYKVISMFSDQSLTYAAIITPVILFLISLVGFLLFIKETASFKFSKEKSWLIAILAGLFYAFTPAMLHRTVAGIPEIESLGMAFFWFAFLFFTLSFKAENKKKQILFGVLAGIFTGAMSWSWGGYRFIYMILSLTSITLFLFGNKRLFFVFSSWAIPALFIEFLKVKSITAMLSGFADIGFGAFVLFILLLDFALTKSKIKDKAILKKINLPDPVKTILIGIVLSLIIMTIISPSFIVNSFSSLIERLLYPFGRERVSLTVAENKAPYFTEALGSFGSLVWIFLLGNLILFYEATRHFGRKNKFWFNFFFIILLFALVFTRFSQGSMFNGENFLSKFVYLGSILLFVAVLFGTYIKAHIMKDEKTINDFNNLEFQYILILAFSFLAMVSMRGAVRLFFIISPMLIIPSAFVPTKLWEALKENKDDLTKLFIGIILIVSIFFFIGTFAKYSVETTLSVQGTVPSQYTQQWQKAMSWIRESTPENSIFVHWWDYGYWVQTIGERPTVTDGAHANAWWDHTTARYLLTTPNPETALSLMKTHNVSYLLIDSTDLGKYTAYSSIGSDANGDRFSQIPVMVFDPSQTVETAGREARLYQGTTIVDEDIVYTDGNGTNIFLPANSAYVIGMIIETQKNGNSISVMQPTTVFFYNNQQIRLPLRYAYSNGELMDFGTGIDGVARITQGLTLAGQGVSVDPMGAVIYLSPRVSKGLFAQLYLMDDVFNNYETVTLAYNQPDPIVESLRAQGLGLDDIVYFQGFRGPISIWKTEIPSNIIAREEFLSENGVYEYAGLDNLTFSM